MLQEEVVMCADTVVEKEEHSGEHDQVRRSKRNVRGVELSGMNGEENKLH